MSVVAFFSAKGAPGTTTTAMLVASLWPRPALLVDGDPAGGDIALRLPAPDGRPLDLSKGLLSLLPLARRDISPDQVLEHAQPVLGGGDVIAGVAGPEQATAAGPVWSAVADVLSRIEERDVIVDLGRLTANSAVLPVARRADLAIMVVRDNLSGVFAARGRLRTVAASLAEADGGGPVLGFVVQSDHERDAKSAASVIQTEFAGVRYVGRLAWDVAGVRMFDGQTVSRPERTMIVRSGRDVVGALDGALCAIALPEPAAGHEQPEPTGIEQRAASKGRLGRRKHQDVR